jgi:hypothetical protein
VRAVTVDEELLVFLLDRLGEDETAARAATGNRWRTTEQEGVDIEDADHPDTTGIVYSSPDGGCTNWQTADHIARWDPARVLDECASKRWIVEECRDLDEVHDSPDAIARAGSVLRLMAKVYRSHPGYRPEWTP